MTSDKAVLILRGGWSRAASLIPAVLGCPRLSSSRVSRPSRSLSRRAAQQCSVVYRHSPSSVRNREGPAGLGDCAADGLRPTAGPRGSPVGTCAFCFYSTLYTSGLSLTSVLPTAWLLTSRHSPTPAWPPRRPRASTWRVLMTLPGPGALLWTATCDPRRREILVS